MIRFYAEFGQRGFITRQSPQKCPVVRQQFGKRLSQVLLEQCEATQPVPGPTCSECGEEMQYKSEKRYTIPSTIGELRLEHGYYSCAACKGSLFPLDQELGLIARERCSPRLAG